MVKQNWFIYVFHYVLLVGLNVSECASESPAKEASLDIANTVKSKRDTGSDTLSSYALDDMQKRAPKLFLGMRGKKIPSGFVGVRGRRLDQAYYQDQPMMWDSSNLEDGTESNEFLAEKRMPFSIKNIRGMTLPSGFVRARGRRIPVAFLGMRGKKNEIYTESGPLLSGSHDDKRTPSGFLGMRGKKQDSLQQDDALSANLNNFDLNEIDRSSLAKRAPRAFLGMRG